MEKDWNYYRLQWEIMLADMRERELLAKQKEYRKLVKGWLA